MKNKFLLPGLIIVMVGLVVAGGLVIKKMAESEKLGHGSAVGTSGTAEIPQESNMPLPNAENVIGQRSATIEPAADALTWAVYQNSEYGIGFEYPAQWKVEGAEIRDPASDAYIAVSRLENPQNLSFDEWWQANMIVGGRPTALYASKDIDINGVKAKILYQPEGKSGWHVHIADRQNNIYSLFAQGGVGTGEIFNHVLSSLNLVGVSGQSVSGAAGNNGLAVVDYDINKSGSLVGQTIAIPAGTISSKDKLEQFLVDYNCGISCCGNHTDLSAKKVLSGQPDFYVAECGNGGTCTMGREIEIYRIDKDNSRATVVFRGYKDGWPSGNGKSYSSSEYKIIDAGGNGIYNKIVETITNMDCSVPSSNECCWPQDCCVKAGVNSRYYAWSDAAGAFVETK